MADVFREAERLGVRMACAYSALPELALLVIYASGKRELLPDDAERLYTTYWSAAGRRRLAITKSYKVQVAKMRKLIELGVMFRRDGMRLARRALELHAQLYLRTSVKYLDSYNALVGVARRQVNRKSRDLLSDALIKKAMRG